ncbi:hypothetical protein BP00DRAFT_416371 [Aspergillus indologenus CBS 114.80]|uniref:Uncharacterized protein n=1 Tax=Aspergillus indologenus CBS 114.80 TaxID=1450541 RepID=A0A2V5I2X0_9EURO|nr:hypothetical protein BP00DRAFT_416371 [Aspergillus indologenus CBS 114.80]
MDSAVKFTELIPCLLLLWALSSLTTLLVPRCLVSSRCIANPDPKGVCASLREGCGSTMPIKYWRCDLFTQDSAVLRGITSKTLSATRTNNDRGFFDAGTAVNWYSGQHKMNYDTSGTAQP